MVESVLPIFIVAYPQQIVHTMRLICLINNILQNFVQLKMQKPRFPFM